MRFFLTFLFALTFTVPALAQDQLVHIRLIPERGQIAAGEEIWIGIEQEIAHEWHTYWKNPGDSGTAPRISWDLPDGFEVSDIHWPVPDKIPYEPLLNYGYSDNVILLQKLKAPDVLPDGAINLSADVEVLVCKEECIPEFGTYTLSLNDANMANNGDYLSEATSKLPKLGNLEGTFSEQDGQFIVSVQGMPSIDEGNEIEILPYEWGLVSNPETAQWQEQDGKVFLSQKRGERSLAEIEGRFNGVLAFEENGVRVGYQFSATHDPVLSYSDAMQPEAYTDARSFTLPLALVFALLGGMILNLMPCVFPVLSLKALHLVKAAEKPQNHVKASGLVYTLGVILSFLAIAGILLAIKAGGETVGWGFQLQNPFIVGALAYLTFLIGLNLSGFYEIKGGFTNFGGRLAGKDSLSGSFFTGVLATLVATPCSAPFMAGAIGYALVQSPTIALLVFAVLGLGLALPYLLLSFSPALQKAMPKPGAWMETFRQFLAFPMFAASVWLVSVCGAQAGINGVIGVLSGMVALGLAIWLWNNKPFKSNVLKFFVMLLFALCITAALYVLPRDSVMNDTPQMDEMSEVFNEEKLGALLEGEDAVFVEMTASWCIVCKVNEALAINVPSTRALFAEKNVHFLVGDWTNKDDNITKYIESHGRSGVPLYVYYKPRVAGEDRPHPVVLPQVLTPAIIADVLEK
ncbi:MAG: thioredoxin family protein [Micavibrio sp.]|nr:thioredoxin family protein [Micavibrio sp.]